MTQPEHRVATRTATLEIGGQDVVLAYADERAEYEALRRGAIVVDRSHRGRLRVFRREVGRGAHRAGDERRPGDAARTGSIRRRALVEGAHRRRRPHLRRRRHHISSTRRRARGPGCSRMVKKYVNPRVSGYRDDSHAIRDIGVFGVEARAIVVGDDRRRPRRARRARAVRARGRARSRADRVTIARAPDIGVEGYELFVPFEIFDRVWERAVEAGATPAGLGAWEIARVEAGRVRSGASTSTTRRFRRKRTSTSSTPSRTRRAATSGRRSWRACTSAAT